MLGDMNYRIDLPFDRCVTLYNTRNFGGMMAHDQLRREQVRGRVFHSFLEGRIDFPPTYRYATRYMPLLLNDAVSLHYGFAC